MWPTVGLWSASVPGGDVLLVLGPEPSLRWRLFCAQLVGVAERLRRADAISLGALLADVPHTRPVQIIGTASDPELIDRFDLQRSRYEGPTGIVGVLHDAMATAGIAAASLWAAVPAVRRPGAVAEGGAGARRAGVRPDRQPGARRRASPARAAEYDARVAALIADDEDLVEYVSRLESLVDDELDDDDDEIDDDDRPTPLDAEVDPDELVAEVEQFLRDRDPDDAVDGQRRHGAPDRRADGVEDGRELLAVDRGERHRRPPLRRRRSPPAGRPRPNQPTSAHSSGWQLQLAAGRRAVEHAACTCRSGRSPSAARR